MAELIFIVSMVGFSRSLFEAEEVDGEVEICLRKDLVTASAFTVTLTPQETAPNPPETFRARGKKFCVRDNMACYNTVAWSDYDKNLMVKDTCVTQRFHR